MLDTVFSKNIKLSMQLAYKICAKIKTKLRYLY